MRTLAIIVVLYITYLHSAVAVMKTEQKSLHFPGKELMFDHRSFTDQKFVYAECNESLDYHERSCTVKRQKSINSNDSYSCELTIKAEKGNLTKKFQVVPFGQDKVIVVVAETINVEKEDSEAFIQIKTIELESCTVTEVRYPAEAWFSSHMGPMLTTVVVPYDDSFDVFYPDKKLCSNRHCRVTIDKNGKVVGGPQKSIELTVGNGLKQPIIPIESHSPDKGLFFVDFEHFYVGGHSTGQIDVSVLHPNGSTTTVDSFHNLGYQGMVISTENNIISVCFKSSHITCLQYDSEYKLKLNVTFPQYIPYKTYLISVYNMANGDFLLLIGRRQTSERTIHPMKIDRNMQLDLSLIRANKTGQVVGTASLNAPKCDMEFHRYAAMIEEDANKGYCVSLACFTVPYIPLSQNRLEIAVDCLTDEDFAK